MTPREQPEISNKFVRWGLLFLLGIIPLATSATAGELRKFELPSQRGIFQQPQIQQQAPRPPKSRHSIYKSFQQDVQDLSKAKKKKLEASLEKEIKKAMGKNNFKQANHFLKLLSILKNPR